MKFRQTLTLSMTLAAAILSIHGHDIYELSVVPRIERWEKTIKGFEELDAESRLPRGAVLLIGGSNARRWLDVDEAFPEQRVINRGFGGARLSEVLHFADRLILPLAPKVILVNAGGNDLSAGCSPTQVHETAEALVTSIREGLPDAHIYFMGLPYMRRAHENSEAMAVVRSMNEKLSSLAENEVQVEFIDLVPAFFDEKGEFPTELFVKDGVHFSEKGYEVLAGLLRKKL